jgi:ribosomal protein S12 methylthiotransferase
MREAEALVRAGVRELLVISQDTSAYGSDLRYPRVQWQGREYQTRLLDLVRALGTLGAWVRLHYVYPYPHVDEVIPLMHASGVLPYLDIPFQHGSPSVLKRMRRPAHTENTLQRIAAWRRERPELVLRSSFIVGFPGETEAEFEELLSWLEEAQLDRVGCFQYSPVQDAAANALPNPVPDALKQERYERFMQKAAQISHARLLARVGQRCEILIDEVGAHGAVGRSFGEAPQIDGTVQLSDSQAVKVGEIVPVQISGAEVYDLQARRSAAPIL